MSSEMMASRAIGQYPLSIATSLAIESACGIHPEIVVKSMPLIKYDELWVNLRTLFRNIIGSLGTENSKLARSSDICQTMHEEMETITDVIAEHSGGRVSVVYYVSNYQGMETKYKHATIRMDTTNRQMLLTSILNETIERLLKTVEPNTVAVFERKLKMQATEGMPLRKPKALIITHYAYDLLSYKIFQKLDLLESHTGTIKDKSLWYTKYYNGKDLNMIPFREDLIQIFGDSETFRTFDPKVRKDILEIAEKYRWSSVTTYEKIRYGILTMKNPYAKAIILDMLSVSY